MPTFVYDSITRTGDESTGSIDATTRAEAVRLLRQRGETATSIFIESARIVANSKKKTATRSRSVPVVHVRPRKATQTGGKKKSSSGRVRRGELASFIREIATALEAGLPLMGALRAMSQQKVNLRQAALVDHLMDQIEAGRSFAQAAVEWGAPFDDMIIGMLKAGEASGKLDAVMLQLADLLDRNADMKRSVTGALVYPAFLIVLLSGGITVISTITIPKILSVVGDEGITMPLPTRIVQGFAYFMGSYWWVLLGVAIAGWLLWRWMMAQYQYQFTFHRILLSIPVLGPLLRDVAVGRFTRTLGTLMGSGIPVLDALMITRDTLGNRVMENVIDDVVEQVRAGHSIAEPMERSGYFPPLLIQIIGLGEKTGRLDTMLSHAATSFDRKTQASLTLFTTVLPPAILVVMALAVGFVLAAAILPLVEMQSNIG